MPGAEKRPEGYGGSMAGGPPRAVWHITWDELGPGGKQPSFDAIAGYLKSVNYCPHLMWDPWSGKVVQFYPANQSGRALGNMSGGVETNRMGRVCIQVEVFFSPGAVRAGKKYLTVADTPCKGLKEIVAWMRSWGVPDEWPLGWPKWSGNLRSARTWRTEAGHYGHSHVPENDHTDPGPMPRTMFSKTPAPKPPAPPAPQPLTQEEDMPYGQLTDGVGAVTVIALPKGRYKTIGFSTDNGLAEKPPVKLRVAVRDTDWHVQRVVVDSAKGQTVITFADVAHTDSISVRREDAGDVPVGWEVS
jgi:hypothetical protein